MKQQKIHNLRNRARRIPKVIARIESQIESIESQESISTDLIFNSTAPLYGRLTKLILREMSLIYDLKNMGYL